MFCNRSWKGKEVLPSILFAIFGGFTWNISSLILFFRRSWFLSSGCKPVSLVGAGWVSMQWSLGSWEGPAWALQVRPWCHLLTATLGWVCGFARWHAPGLGGILVTGFQWNSDKTAAAPAALSAACVVWGLARGRGGSRGDWWSWWRRHMGRAAEIPELRYQTLLFCSVTAQSELRNLIQHEPAGRAQLVGISVETGEPGKAGMVAAAAWGWCSQGLEGPSSAQGCCSQKRVQCLCVMFQHSAPGSVSYPRFWYPQRSV